MGFRGLAMSDATSSSAGSEDAWDQVTKDLLKESQDDSDETAKCTACRSDTEESNPVGPKKSRAWWAELIRTYTKGFGCTPFFQNDPKMKITMVSACAGIFAEGEALKASNGFGLGVWDF